jgi:hypothetical protein
MAVAAVAAENGLGRGSELFGKEAGGDKVFFFERGEIKCWF